MSENTDPVSPRKTYVDPPLNFDDDYNCFMYRSPTRKSTYTGVLPSYADIPSQPYLHREEKSEKRFKF